MLRTMTKTLLMRRLSRYSVSRRVLFITVQLRGVICCSARWLVILDLSAVRAKTAATRFTRPRDDPGRTQYVKQRFAES
jgi:hypothetical protein